MRGRCLAGETDRVFPLGKISRATLGLRFVLIVERQRQSRGDVRSTQQRAERCFRLLERWLLGFLLAEEHVLGTPAIERMHKFVRDEAAPLLAADAVLARSEPDMIAE